jgi:hypothetical protein
MPTLVSIPPRAATPQVQENQQRQQAEDAARNRKKPEIEVQSTGATAATEIHTGGLPSAPRPHSDQDEANTHPSDNQQQSFNTKLDVRA